MPILNYTTEVKIEKTIGEITNSLLKAKANAILQEYKDGLVTHISFKIETKHGILPFRLPANIDGVQKALYATNVSRKYKTREQATRVAWRIVKDWVQAQAAMIEAQMADTAEVFLPYLQTDNGKTIYELFEEKGVKMLGYDNK